MSRAAPGSRRWMAVLVALVVTTIGAPATASADVPEIASCYADADLGVGSIGPSVSCLQFALVLEGLYRGPLNGRFDEATAQAVAWYQASHPPLAVTGVAESYTLAFLGIHSGVVAPAPRPCLADATLSLNRRGESVACLQHALIREGLYGGSVTGLYDGPTQDAVRSFQRAHRLKSDGMAGPATLTAMGIWSGNTVKGVRTGPGPFPSPMHDDPFWNLTKNGIPYYGFGTPCTPTEAAVIAAEFAVDGADADTQQWAVYIASREGGCRYDAVNLNMATKDDSHCTFQLNALSGMFNPTAVLGRRGWTVDNVKSSLVACADAASDLWVACGRGAWTKPYSCVPPFAAAPAGQPAPQVPPTVPTTTTAPEPPTTSPPIDPGTTTTTVTTTASTTSTTAPS